MGAIKVKPGGGVTPNTYFLSDTPVMVTPLSKRHRSQDDTGGVSLRHPTPVMVTPEGCHGDTQTIINPKEPKSNPPAQKGSVLGTVPEIPTPPNLVRERKPKSVEEVITSGQNVGVSEQDCRDWFRDCQEAKWTRGDGTPFDNWRKQLQIHRDKLRAQKHLSNGSPKRDLFISEMRTLLAAKEERIAWLRFTYAEETGEGYRWGKNVNEKAECASLAKEIDQLKTKLAGIKV